MKESIGLTFTFNIIIVFLIVSFVILAATVSYMKAFRAGSAIVNALEKYEGYNELSKREIGQKLTTLGYMRGNSSKCNDKKRGPSSEGVLTQLESGENFEYCIYFFDNDGGYRHYVYGVTTFATFDFTMFKMRIKVPVYIKSRRTYRFNINSSR